MTGANTATHAALYQAALSRRATVMSLLADARLGTLQKVPAPIARLDVVHPFPLPLHPIIPYPGDAGAFATAAALEDR